MTDATLYTLVGLVSGGIATLAYGLGPRWERARDKKLLKAYPGIWRIASKPEEGGLAVEARADAITVGDYGWEAEPLVDDNLLYLQGLTPDWKVVWYAGFRKDQLEHITIKPASQYYRHPYWVNSPPSDCPYPVHQTHIGDLGYAVELEHNWVQGRTVNGIIPVRSRRRSPSG
jgi:hypothetical protein